MKNKARVKIKLLLILAIVFTFGVIVFVSSRHDVQKVEAVSWYNESWGYRKKITINSAQVDADLSNFPVYVDLSDMGADFFSRVKSDGGDIVVTSSDGITKLSRELVSIDKVGETGELWFKAPSLLDASDTEFYIYYGNGTATESNDTSTWSKFNAVYHLNQDPSGSAPQVLDSTSNNNDGSTVGSMTNGDLVAAQIGNGYDLDGINDSYNVGSNSTLATTRIYMSAWVRFDNFSGRPHFICKGQSSTVGSYCFVVETSGQLRFYRDVGGGWGFVAAGTLSSGTWYHLVATYDSNNQIRIYRNGTQLVNTGASGNIRVQSTNLNVGRYNSGNYGPTNGIMDEVRITNQTLSQGWVTTEYNNQSAPSTFSTIGSEEALSTGDWYNDNWKCRNKITIFANEVDANLTDFPVYINLGDLDLNFHTYVKDDGTDIVVTDSDGTTKLFRELVSIDTNAQTGELWFKAPSLSSTVNNDFYIYYCNAAANETNDTQTWNSDYQIVEHMDDDPTGTFQDSTSNNQDGTPISLTSGSSVNGYIGDAIDFDGTADLISYGTNSLMRQSGGITYDYWVYIDSGSTGIMGVGASGGHGYGGMVQGSSLVFSWTPTNPGGDNSISCSTGSSLVGGWHKVSFGINFSTKNYTCVVDGVIQSPTLFRGGDTDWTPVASYNSGLTDYIGGRYVNSQQYFDGRLDEVRISSGNKGSAVMITEYNNQSSPTTFYDIEFLETLSDWHNDAWPFRIKITIPATSVYDDVVDFPVYVDLNDLGAEFFDEVKSDGSDILVTSFDGVTKLSRELVSLDISAQTGELWFKAEALSQNFDNEFYIYFGNGGGAETNSTDVWSNGYAMVQHLQQDPSAGNTIDSTSFGNNAIPQGSFASNDSISGQLGKGIEFDGIDEYLEIASATEISAQRPITLSAWIKRDTLTETDIIFNKRGGTNDGYGFFINTSDQLSYVHYGVTNVVSTGTVDSSWRYVNITVDSSGNYTFYIDGNSAGSGSIGVPTTTTNPLRISTTVDSSGVVTSQDDQQLDELRISTDSKTSGWIQTEYLNQFSPNTFYTVDTIDTDRILKVHQDNDTPSGTGAVLVCMQALEEIVADSQFTINFEQTYSITGSGSFSTNDYTAYCDSDGEEGGSQTEMANVSISNQTGSSITFDTNIDTCTQWMCIDFAGGSQVFQNPSSAGNYEWKGELDIGGDATIEETQTTLSFIGNTNEINVSGYIPPIIALDIYEQNSETRTNSCDLGVLSINSVNMCVYDVGASVNATTGVSLYMSGSGGLVDNLGNNIDPCTATGCDAKGGAGVTAGEEEYGFYVSETGSGEYSVVDYYETQHQPVPDSFSLIASSSSTGSGTASGSFAQRLEFTHAASIDLATPSGNYSQVLTFRLYSN